MREGKVSTSEYGRTIYNVHIILFFFFYKK